MSEELFSELIIFTEHKHDQHPALAQGVVFCVHYCCSCHYFSSATALTRVCVELALADEK